jgi:hypothetical protein
MKPTVIEDEPSHEIYANLIGKSFASIIIPHPATALMQQSQDNYTSVIPSTDSESSTAPFSTTAARMEQTKEGTNDSEHNQNSIADVYRRAFSSESSLALSQISLSKKNKGYQLLTKMGFEEKDGGLGKNRQGQVTPMKTMLKLDRRGLGSGKRLIPRVTHRRRYCHHNLKSTIEKETKGTRRRRLKDEAEKERMKQKRARLMMNSDLPEEYGAYLGLA